MELDIVFRNNNKEKLIGILSYPEGKETFPGVVFCHGFSANKNSLFFPDLAEKLVAEGYAILRFDCRACGKSEGKIHPTYKTMVEDLESAINYFEKDERITNISLVGHSMGGTSVIMAADEKIKSLVSIAGVANPGKSAQTKKSSFKHKGTTYSLTLPTYPEKILHFTEEWFIDANNCKPLEKIKTLGIPKLIIHGTEDKRINIKEGKQLFITAKLPKSIKMIEGANHLFKNHNKKLIESIIQFIKKNK